MKRPFLIYPAIDLKGGRVVRLHQGRAEAETVYSDDPVAVARRWQDEGARYLHVVDLDGAKSKKIVNQKTLEIIAKRTSLVVDFGGGLKSNDDLRVAFECGAQMITGGSIAVKDKDTFCNWLEMYGGDKIILGADAKNEKIAVTGWLEDSGVDLWGFIGDYMKEGVRRVICTDISKDGMLMGPSTELYLKMKSLFPGLFVIASGGISCIGDVAVLEEKGIDSVIIGKAIYEGKITMKELQQFII